MIDPIAVQNIFSSFSKRTTAPLSLGYIDLNSGISVYLHPHFPMPAASTYKIFLLMELFLKLQRKEVSFCDKVTLTDEDKSPGTGILYDLSSGLELTLHDVAILMISISDNTAADMLYRILTPESVRKDIIDGLQLSATQLEDRCRSLIYRTYKRPIQLQESSNDYFRHATLSEQDRLLLNGTHGNCTSAADLSRALREIYNGVLFTPDSRKEMLRILSLCQTNQRIPKKLPTECQVSHKTGSLDRITNDAGIVFSPHGNYILTLLMNGNLAILPEYAENTGRCQSDALLSDLSAEIYRLYSLKEASCE